MVNVSLTKEEILFLWNVLDPVEGYGSAEELPRHEKQMVLKILIKLGRNPKSLR